MKSRAATCVVVILSSVAITMGSGLAEPVGRLPHGVVQAVATDGSLGFIGNGAELQITDVSIPVAPVIVSRIQFDSDIRSLAVDSDRVYVGTLHTVHVIDVGDPTAPVELGVLSRYGVKYAMGASGNVVCIVEGYEVIVVDVADPASPSVVGAWSGARSFDVEVEGRYAYVAASGLRVIDLVDPSNPTEVGFYGVSAESLDLEGDFVYAAGERVSAISVIHPSAPVLASLVDLPTGQYGTDIDVFGDLAYVTTLLDGLHIVEIGASQTLTLRGNAPPPVDRPNEQWVAVAGVADLAIVATTDHGVRIIQAIDPADPEEVAVIDAPGYTIGGAVTGAILVTANQNRGIRTLDISSPADPQELAIVEIDPWLWVDDVDVEGSLAVAVGRAVTVLDISSPAAPVVVGELPDWEAQGMAVELVGDLAYVADPVDGLRVISVADPASPVEIGSLALPGSDWEYLDVDGSLLVLQGTTIEVISVADPHAPISLSTIASGAGRRGIALQGSTLFIVGGGWFRTFDLADPISPVETNATYSPGSLSPIGVSGSTAYLGNAVPDAPFTIEVWDIADPNDPVLRETYAGAGWVRDFAFTGDHVVSTRFNSGIDVIEHLPGLLFRDGFEAGDTTGWSTVYPTSSD